MARRFYKSLDRRRSRVNPFFFAEWYQQRYLYNGDAQLEPLAHYLRHHREPGVNPNPYFDSAYYRDRYMTADDRRSALEHFWEEGERKGHNPHPAWQEDIYTARNLDLGRSIRLGRFRSGYHHFCPYGAQEIVRGSSRALPIESRQGTTYFEESGYLESHPDVALEVKRHALSSGLEHYFRKGYYDEINGHRDLYTKRLGVELVQSIDCCAPRAHQDIVIFAHYDPDGIVDLHVFAYLRSLAENNCDIIFVSPGFSPADENVLRGFCRHIIRKNDAGRDFG